MRTQGKIASSTWAYTAGSPYTPKETYGSLTFGGYDRTRFVPNNLTFNFGIDISRDLLVGVQAISSGPDSQSLLPNGIIAFIDSTVSQIWLPLEACQRFETVFGLVWDADTELYLVYGTLHDTLVSKNANITFTLGKTESRGQTIDITLPYASFDLTARYPLVSNATSSSRYFPLKRAANDKQYTLGRAFLQEAYVIPMSSLHLTFIAQGRAMLIRPIDSQFRYVIVDYDRSNFSVSQALFPDPSVSSHLVPVLPPQTGSSTASTPLPAHHHGLSKGLIAGIVIAAVIFIVLLIIATLFVMRKLRSRRAAKDASNPDWIKPELDGKDTTFLGAYEVPAEGRERGELEGGVPEKWKGLTTPPLQGGELDGRERRDPR